MGSLKYSFWIKLATNLSNTLTIINIDECCINKNTKINYSWLAKGKNCPVTNIKYKNSLKIISAMCSNWFSMNVSVYRTTKGSKFLKFLRALESELETCCCLRIRECLTILDNCKVLRTKYVLKKYFKQHIQRCTIIFHIPQRFNRYWVIFIIIKALRI